MMRSLYSGITGLKNHQTRMDVVANNISNVNTVGFKGSRVIFQDIYSQTLSQASGNVGGIGGTNSRQIGLGMQLASIDLLHNRSASQYTGSPLDLAIEGDGFFIVNNNGQENYTRAGNFYLDEKDILVNANGFQVKGYSCWHYVDPATGNYVDNPTAAQIPNLIVGNKYFDNSTGTPVAITNYNDAIAALKAGKDVTTDTTPTGGVNQIYVHPSIQDIGVDKNGIISGLDKSGNKVVIGTLALATFENQSGLEKIGQNLYAASNNSGAAVYGTPGGDNGAGLLNPGTLEMSNVDLSTEFTDMIVTQRGFQANSRIITVSDSMLEELVNLKR